MPRVAQIRRFDHRVTHGPQHAGDDLPNRIVAFDQ